MNPCENAWKLGRLQEAIRCRYASWLSRLLTNIFEWWGFPTLKLTSSALQVLDCRLISNLTQYWWAFIYLICLFTCLCLSFFLRSCCSMRKWKAGPDLRVVVATNSLRRSHAASSNPRSDYLHPTSARSSRHPYLSGMRCAHHWHLNPAP